jgi:uncharacterized LabA/DUF88 family protein
MTTKGRTVKATRGRPAKQKAVAVFVDYENIRRRLKANFGQDVEPGRVAKALHEIACEQGQFRFGKFYGDWALRPKDARAIEAQKFKAEHVLRTPGGKDRTDAAMNVELGDQAGSKDFAVAVIAAGDGDYTYAIRKLREKGKTIVVVAVSIDAARELLTVADTFIPIEKHLNLDYGSAPEGTVEQALWQPFITKMLGLESALPYVVWAYLRDRILTAAEGGGSTMEEREQFLERAKKDGLLEVAEIDNPKVPGRKVKTVRLDRSHPAVAQALLAR